MGLLDVFRFASQVAARPRAVAQSSSGIRSPWTSGQLTSWSVSDILGADVVRPVSRADAMRVPAIAKGRALICGPLARHPLAVYRGAERVSSQPPWLSRTDTSQSPEDRMLWTLDDLIFYGMSLWGVARTTRGQIMDAARVPVERWHIDPSSLEILVNDQPVEPGTHVLIQGPQDPLLDIAADDIRAARAMTAAWKARVTSPVPLVELHNTDPNAELMPDEIDELIESWETARQSGGATGYTPAQIETKVHGQASTELFVEGRNASRLDFANFLNLPASLLEGSQATATLTYSTSEGKRNELVDYSLGYWACPVESRLSADDVTTKGTRVAFDLSWLTSGEQGSSGPAKED